MPPAIPMTPLNNSRSPVHETLRLYTTPETYIIEPSYLDPTVLSENLVISRQSGVLRRNVPAIPTQHQETVTTIYGVLGMLRLYSGDHLIVVTSRIRIGRLFHTDIWQLGTAQILPVIHNGQRALSEVQREAEEECLAGVRAMLHEDRFYFTYMGLDLTRAVGSSGNGGGSSNAADARGHLFAAGVPLWQQVDPRFHFNRHLQRKMMEITQRDPEQDMSGFLLPIMSGFIEVRPGLDLRKRKVTFALVSRRGCQRVGTRYFSRGIDAEGNVSNFVETEQLLIMEDDTQQESGGTVYGHVQIRGSIPLYWRQVVNVKYQPSLEVVQNPQTTSAFKRHVDELITRYGPVLAWNLVNKKGYELLVGDAFTRQVDALNNPKFIYNFFDFHHECRKMQWHNIEAKLLKQYERQLEEQDYAKLESTGKLTRRQTSVVRTNCMDCLDRTNVVQSEVAKQVLARQLRDAGVLNGGESVLDLPDFYFIFRNVWADHADAVSKHYSGTGALKTDFTRTGRRTKSGAAQDGWNSVVRYVKNNFLDGRRQDAYDLVLGRFEVTPMRAPPASATKGWAYYVLPAIAFIAWIAILLMLATATSSRILALGFWFVILLSALRMIVANGKLFVVLPSLCPPYDDPSPFVVASKKTGIITKDKAVALSSMSGSSGDMNIKIA